MDKNNNEIYERILQFEERTSNNLNQIYLIKDSNNSQWYKAYEWSAYLLEFMTNNLQEKDRLKPLKKQLENTNKTIINVGFPLTSIEKFCNPNIIEDKVVDGNQNITIRIKSSNNLSFENYKQNLNNWKNSIQIKQYNNQNQNKSINIYSHPTTFLSIMKDIMKFNTYGKSEEDYANFLNDLKSKCADLIC